MTFLEMFVGFNKYGKLIMMMGLLIMVPLLVIPFYPDEIKYADAFIIPAAFSVLAGGMIGLWADMGKNKLIWKSSLTKGSTPVLFVWCYAFFIGSMPFVITMNTPMTLALFESVSGWTTTGLTVMDVETLPKILLFHRSFMQYCGGLGFVIMIAMVLKASSAASMYNAEGHNDKLEPSLRRTSKVIGGMYLIWLVAGSLAYVISGLTPMDGICHAMSALSTAGFSTKADSIGAFNSIPVDIITIVLMIIGATNFVIVRSLMRFDFKRVFRDSEFRFMSVVIAVSTIVVAADLVRTREYAAGRSFIEGLFEVVTTFSTTGYSLDDYSRWPAVSLGVTMVLMVIGGCAGSTAGGIKMRRAYFILLNTFGFIRNQLKPARKVSNLRYRKNKETNVFDNDSAATNSGFVFMYLIVIITGILLVAGTAGCSLSEAAFEFTSALGTVGLSNGITCADAHTSTLLVEMIGMILGRLEIFMVLIGVYGLFQGIKELAN